MKNLLHRLHETKIKFTDDQVKVVEKLLNEQQKSMQPRFSLKSFFTPLIVSFGLVATLYGFQKILDATILVNQPWLMLGVGILILLLTGVYYQKL